MTVRRAALAAAWLLALLVALTAKRLELLKETLLGLEVIE